MNKTHRRHLVLFFILGPMCLVELTLTGTDLGLWGSPLWRSYAYLYGAFRPAFLFSPSELWDGQRYGMFLTHVFLHIGPVHFLSNAVAMFALGHYALERIRQRDIVSVTFFSAVGGALMFALIPGSSGVMTGASGALSGLAAAWGVQSLRSGNTPPRSLAIVLGVIAIATTLEMALQDRSAWQAHFGGAITGAVMGLFLKRRGAQI